MEIKKTDKASLKEGRTLYFLVGLNVALLTIILLFNFITKTIQAEEVVKEDLIVENISDTRIIPPPAAEIPPPPPPKQKTPPPPKPEIIDEVKEVVKKEKPKPIEPKPEPKPVIPTKPTKPITPKPEPTGPANFGEIGSMAIFPGCERFKDDGKEALKDCFDRRLQQKLYSYLDTDRLNEIGRVGQVKLNFVIGSDGYISEIKAVGSPKHRIITEQAFNQMVESMRKKGNKIIPAKLADGTVVGLTFGKGMRYD